MVVCRGWLGRKEREMVAAAVVVSESRVRNDGVGS